MRTTLLLAIIFFRLAASASAGEIDSREKADYLVNFSKQTGAYPASEPIVASDGNYYGVLPDLARNGAGSIYKASPEGTITVLHRFKGTDGEQPVGRLLQASDGVLYGATHSGGQEKGCGTVFRITLDGIFDTLHIFNCGKHGGANPAGGLIQAQNGLLYGLTEGGGSHRDGTVYSINADGSAFTIVANLSYAFSGSTPKGELLQTPDGMFFGTAMQGGAHGDGTLFSMSLDGTLTRERAFSGSTPNSGLAYSSVTDTVYGTLVDGLVFQYHKGMVRSYISVFYGDSLMGGLSTGLDGETLYGFCASTEGGCVYLINTTHFTTKKLVGNLKGNVAGRPSFDSKGTILGSRNQVVAMVSERFSA